jgi:hypothetical protein
MATASIRERTSGSARRTVLRDLARIRVDDARALLATKNQEQRNAAVYLAGYAVECGLKARICQERNDEVLNEVFEGHELWRLANVTTLFSQQPRHSTTRQRLSALDSQWHVTMRYFILPYNHAEVDAFIKAVEEFVKWLQLA